MVNKILTQEEIEKFPHSFYSHAEAILHLSEVGIDVKQTRVADWLDVSRANVSQVVGRMQNSGLVEFKEDLELTTKGLYLSQIISRRHRITERFLSEVLNLSWDKVYKETRKWENVLTMKNFERNDMYVSEILHFLKCVKDRKKTINTIDEGIETMKIALAMKKSSKSRRMVNI